MNLPNWKDNDFYAGLKNYFPHGVAWEFWRLNLEYQKEYEEWAEFRESREKYKIPNSGMYQNVPQNFLEQDERAAEIEIKWLRRRGTLPDYKKDYTKIGNLETLFHFIKTVIDDEGEVQKERLEIFPEKVENRIDFEKFLDFDSFIDPDSAVVAPPYFICAFRHDFPADRQIENLRKIFKKHADFNGRVNYDKEQFIFSLRVHHATQVGVGIKEIGETLLTDFDGTEDERKRVARARKKAPTYIENYLPIVQCGKI